MKTRLLLACLALVGLFSCVSLMTSADDLPAKAVQSPEPGSRILQVGDTAPDKLERKTFAMRDWKRRGLKPPEKDSQWVRVNDKYVLLKTTNGRVMDIEQSKK